jgi:hypothetical protein
MGSYFVYKSCVYVQVSCREDGTGGGRGLNRSLSELIKVKIATKVTLSPVVHSPISSFNDICSLSQHMSCFMDKSSLEDLTGAASTVSTVILRSYWEGCIRKVKAFLHLA